MFGDRLIDDSDRTWLFGCCREVIKDTMKENLNTLLAHLDFEGTGEVTEDNMRSLIYCDFTDATGEERLYVEARDLDAVQKILMAYLAEFNQISKKPMDLVLFR